MYREEIEPLIAKKKHDNKVTDSREEDSIKALTNSDQQSIGSSESHVGKLPTPSIEEEEAMAVQGMDAKHKHII